MLRIPPHANSGCGYLPRNRKISRLPHERGRARKAAQSRNPTGAQLSGHANGFAACSWATNHFVKTSRAVEGDGTIGLSVPRLQVEIHELPEVHRVDAP